MTTADRILDILQSSPNGVTRRELVWQVYRIYTPQHDRSVRKAIEALRETKDVVILPNPYRLVTRENVTPADIEAARAYYRAQYAAVRSQAAMLRQQAERVGGLLNYDLLSEIESN